MNASEFRPTARESGDFARERAEWLILADFLGRAGLTLAVPSPPWVEQVTG